MNIGKSAALAALLISGQAFADSYETTTRETPIPTERNGSLIVRKCSSCAPTLVRLDESSAFRVGSTDVDFRTFSDYVRTSGQRFLHVSYDARTGAVQRLQVNGRLPRRAR